MRLPQIQVWSVADAVTSSSVLEVRHAIMSCVTLASNGKMLQNLAFYTQLCHPSICLEEVRSTTKHRNQLGRSTDRDQNPSSPECETVHP